MGAPHASGAEADDTAARPTRFALSPLRLRLYRRLWLASLVSNLGTWMHQAAGAWLMTTLSHSPLLVALMQTAASLPFFLLAFPAGALADVVDRRRVLLLTQAAVLMVDIVAIQAPPPASRTMPATTGSRTTASVALESAKVAAAATINRSTASRRRSEGSTAAPATAPSPRQPRRRP
jgi:MFS family permease